jgi:hypothetical protein
MAVKTNSIAARYAEQNQLFLIWGISGSDSLAGLFAETRFGLRTPPHRVVLSDLIQQCDRCLGLRVFDSLRKRSSSSSSSSSIISDSSIFPPAEGSKSEE